MDKQVTEYKVDNSTTVQHINRPNIQQPVIGQYYNQPQQRTYPQPMNQRIVNNLSQPNYQNRQTLNHMYQNSQVYNNNPSIQPTNNNQQVTIQPTIPVNQ